MFYSIIDNVQQRQLEGISSGPSNTSLELMDSFLGMRRDLFSQSFPLFWGLERSQESWVYRKMKNTENIVFAVKKWSGLQCLALRNQTILSSDQTERHQRDAPPGGCERRRKKLQKAQQACSETSCDYWWAWGGHRCRCQPVAEAASGETQPSQRSTHISLLLPFIVIVTWKQRSVISNDLYKTSKMHRKQPLCICLTWNSGQPNNSDGDQMAKRQHWRKRLWIKQIKMKT